MIVQNSNSGSRRFVMTMEQHTAFADQLANEFGNSTFSAIENASVRYVIANHDAGWRNVDPEVYIDTETGLPYHLAETPFEYTSQTMCGSPDFNAKYDALAGLLSSMHTAGLLNGRYGLAPPGILARFEGDKKVFAEGVLADELQRQDSLKPSVNVSADFVWVAYKQLQFFDMLSLYFHSKAAGIRGEETFPDVPTAAGDDVTITIAECEGESYTLDPFPFAKSGIEISFSGRWMEPAQDETQGVAVFQKTAVSHQTVCLISA
ncbi:MAG: DUF3891 family protein [Rhodospirillaceae bacterium]|nr:DUF3891 family protein [Rhodospirillaceae bacterium]